MWLSFMREHNAAYGPVVRLTQRNRRAMEGHLERLIEVGQLWVWEAEGDLVGYAAVVPNLAEVELFEASAALTDLYVAPNWRGRGGGRSLLDAVGREVAARGLDALTLKVATGNPARAMYLEAGFKPRTETLALPLRNRQNGRARRPRELP
ncbi:MAG: GNAT family N-acetyltransferase [Candidatus Sericytochromatia bacterium]|nr:GNAT family N-acetyltransferase [Candidatus Sericytochromatia bacterium]